MCCCLSSAAVSGFHRLSRRETDLARPPGWGAAASSGGSCHGPAQGLSSEAERREEREPPLQEALTLSLSRRLCRRLHRFPALGDGSSWRACGTALRLVPPRRSAGPETLFFRDRRLRVSLHSEGGQEEKALRLGLHKTSRPGPLRPRLGGTGACVPVPLAGLVTWLILPVVICLSQRLSHACLSINDSVP